MNLWGHCSSQNANQKLFSFLSWWFIGRAEIWEIFGWHFGRNDDPIRFFQILWPSQNIRTLTDLYCQQILMKSDPCPPPNFEHPKWMVAYTVFHAKTTHCVTYLTNKVRSIMTSESSPSRNKDYFSQVHTILIHPSSAEISICRAQ